MKKDKQVVFMVKIESDGRILNDYYMIEANDMQDAIKRTLKEQLIENRKLTYHININIQATQLYKK